MSYSSNESLHALSGAYVVDALDDDERAAFEEHLRGCSDCRTEVDGLREAAALMADDSATAPPASLRESVLSGISTIRPLPPEKPTAAEAEEPASVVVAMRRTRFRIATLAAAAVVLAILGVGAVLQPWQDQSRAPEKLSAIQKVQDATDVEKTSMDFVDGSTATIYRSRSQGKAAIVTRRMATPPAGKVYELWLQDETGHMAPAGLMSRGGTNRVLLDGDASESTGVGITVEPAGGSDQPTSAPIALFKLKKADT